MSHDPEELKLEIVELVAPEEGQPGSLARAICSAPTHLSGLDDCPLDRKTPFGVTNVTMTQLSIARHYGGITYNGAFFVYFSDTDELVRDDVLAWQKKQRRAKKKPNDRNLPRHD